MVINLPKIAILQWKYIGIYFLRNVVNSRKAFEKQSCSRHIDDRAWTAKSGKLR